MDEPKKSTPKSVASKPAEAELPRILDQLDRQPEEERKKTVENYLAMEQANDKRRIITINVLGICLFFAVGTAIILGHQWTAAILGVAGAMIVIFRRT